MIISISTTSDKVDTHGSYLMESMFLPGLSRYKRLQNATSTC